MTAGGKRQRWSAEEDEILLEAIEYCQGDRARAIKMAQDMGVSRSWQGCEMRIKALLGRYHPPALPRVAKPGSKDPLLDALRRHHGKFSPVI